MSSISICVVILSLILVLVAVVILATELAYARKQRRVLVSAMRAIRLNTTRPPYIIATEALKEVGETKAIATDIDYHLDVHSR